jgi:hypothetical protein
VDFRFSAALNGQNSIAQRIALGAAGETPSPVRASPIRQSLVSRFQRFPPMGSSWGVAPCYRILPFQGGRGKSLSGPDGANSVRPARVAKVLDWWHELVNARSDFGQRKRSAQANFMAFNLLPPFGLQCFLQVPWATQKALRPRLHYAALRAH